MSDEIKIAIAFPKYEADRARIRAMVPPGGPKMPAIYEDGEDRPCVGCKVILNVGPRVAATGVPVYCIVCATRLMQDVGVDTYGIQSLNNPASRDED